ALALEHPDDEVMKQQPALLHEPMINSEDVAKIGRGSLAMTGVTAGAFVYGLSRYGQGIHAQTMAFTTLASSQLLHTFSERTDVGIKKLRKNYVSLSVGAGLAMQTVAASSPGIRKILGLSSLSFGDVVVCGIGALSTLLFHGTVRKENICHSEEIYLSEQPSQLALS
ncbi:MAG: cation-translocating P-type ATPase C-terminal domain-containing protein, partial [Myxococcaceae bacterium]